MPTYTHRDGALRVLDGTGTPYFVEMIFEDGNFSHPLGMQPEPEQRPILNRGRMDSYQHYVSGPDRLDPMQVTFSFKLATNEPVYQKYRDLFNLDLAAAWTVGGRTWVTTKGTTQRLSGDSTRALVTTPGFATGRMRCVNLEYLLTDPSGGAVNVGYKLTEVYFEPTAVTLSEGDDGITISATGQIYGSVTEISAFSAGTES